MFSFNILFLLALTAKLSFAQCDDVEDTTPPPSTTVPVTNSTAACAIQFDGRVPAGSTVDLFDIAASPFNTGFTKGANLNFSEIVLLPNIPASLFDTKTSTLPLEVTISDLSIFQPSPDNRQIGFRRAELMPLSNSGSDPSTTGIKTLHFSLQKDAARPLNTSHEYQLVFLESADFSTNQFVLKTGTILGGTPGADPNRLILQGNVNKGAAELFTVDFKAGVWQNFGLVLDFVANTTQVLYSEGSAPLAKATEALPNDISGQGQYHFGILKKPTGEGLTDITKSGFQPAGIDEGVVYGGVFMEDSSSGCISLA